MRKNIEKGNKKSHEKSNKINAEKNNKSVEENNKKSTEKISLTKILQALLIFAVFVFIGMLLFDFHSSKVMDQSLSEVVDELDKKIEENKQVVEVAQNNDANIDTNTNAEQVQVTKPVDMSVRIGNSTVLGKIKIDKIGIEYPILEYKNDDTLWKSICKISNNTINGTGNLCLAGHNMRNMTMFAKLKNVKKGDTVEITNIYGKVFKYKVYESFYVDPSQVEVLKNTSEPIITMITCNNTSSKRLIVRAKLQ